MVTPEPSRNVLSYASRPTRRARVSLSRVIPPLGLIMVAVWFTGVGGDVYFNPPITRGMAVTVALTSLLWLFALTCAISGVWLLVLEVKNIIR